MLHSLRSNGWVVWTLLAASVLTLRAVPPCQGSDGLCRPDSSCCVDVGPGCCESESAPARVLRVERVEDVSWSPDGLPASHCSCQSAPISPPSVDRLTSRGLSAARLSSPDLAPMALASSPATMPAILADSVRNAAELAGWQPPAYLRNARLRF